MFVVYLQSWERYVTNTWKAGDQSRSFGNIAGANANAWRSRQRIHKPRLSNRKRDSSGGGEEAIGHDKASDDKTNMRWRSKTRSTYVCTDVSNASTNTTSAADNDHRM